MPPRPGDTIELDVTSLAYGGQGVARVDEFVVFVRGAVPGDRVLARVTKRKQSHGEARTLEILSPSPRRVAPRCRHSQECGGCEWQTLAYQAQLEFKQQQVVDSLQRLAHLTDYRLEPIRGMDDPWRYRNKMEFSFGTAEDGGLVLGLHKRGSWREIVDIVDCELASERMNRARLAVAQACRDLGLPVYSRDGDGGLLRHLVVREGRSSGDLLLNLFVAARFPQEAELAARVTAESGCTSFALTVNASRADAAVGDGPYMLAGPPYLRERIAGVDLRVPATAFLQTNSAMCELLYGTALEFAAADAARPSVDLYCGIGSLSLPLARASREVHAIEIQAEAIDAARVNAELNGVDNASFYAADVRPFLRFPPHPVLDAGRADDADRPAVVVADPPRAGLARKALQRAAALGADRFVYVSCNPTTLAGNAAELAELGYRLTVVAPVDMFPHTHHIETVALFERQSLTAAAGPPDAADGHGRGDPDRDGSGRGRLSPTTHAAHDQVGVDGEEGHREQRQRRQGRPVHGEGDGAEERGHHRHRTPAGSQPEAARRPEVEGEEEHVARAQARVRLGVRVARPGGGDGEVADHHRPLLEDRLGRTGRHADDVHHGGDRRHDHDPADALELGGDPDAEGGGEDDLGDVRRRHPAQPHEGDRERKGGEGHQRESPPQRAQRQQAPHERSHGGEHDRRRQHDVRAHRQLGKKAAAEAPREQDGGRGDGQGEALHRGIAAGAARISRAGCCRTTRPDGGTRARSRP